MGAEEMVGGFVVELVGDFEEGEELFAADDGKSVRIKIDDLRCGGKDYVVDLVAQFGGE
jgi:hypothetical protein